MTLTLITLVTVALIVGVIIAGPVIGFRLALDYLFQRFCLHVPHTEDDVTAWDLALQDAHEADTTTVWRHMFRLTGSTEQPEEKADV